MINPVTRKKYLGDKYEMTTVRHSNAVVRAFYEFWIDDMCQGPLINPVRLDRGHRNRRSNAHHNPLQPYKAEGRIRYNPRIPKRQPREMPEERWRDLFAALQSNRDRAILAFAVNNGARASELLGIRSVDLDWGDQLVRVVRKGTQAEQWLPVSPDSFVWLRLYLAELGDSLKPNDRVWQTLRRRDHGRGMQRQQRQPAIPAPPPALGHQAAATEAVHEQRGGQVHSASGTRAGHNHVGEGPGGLRKRARLPRRR